MGRLAGGLALISALLTIIFTLPFWTFSTERAVSLAFLDNITQEKAVVFFGFTHCGDVCPISMAVLTKLFKNTKEQHQAQLPAVVFVDIDRNSNQLSAERFAKNFHKQFIGIYPDDETLAAMKVQFGLNISQSGDVIQHRGRTYLLEKKSDKWQLTKAVNPQNLSKKWLEAQLTI